MIALANGVVSTIQTQLTPAQLAAWGPGYSELINGTGNVSGRAYSVKVQRSVRPWRLVRTSGLAASVGVLACPACGAAGRRALRDDGPRVALSGGAARGRYLIEPGGCPGSRVRAACFCAAVVQRRAPGNACSDELLVVIALALILGSVLASDAGKGVFSRYESIASPSKAATTSVNYREKTLAEIPTDIKNYPFGAGLASAGAARSFGGQSTAIINGHFPGAESQYNYVTIELGLLGLLLWIALSVKCNRARSSQAAAGRGYRAASQPCWRILGCYRFHHDGVHRTDHVEPAIRPVLLVCGWRRLLLVCRRSTAPAARSASSQSMSRAYNNFIDRYRCSSGTGM